MEKQLHDYDLLIQKLDAFTRKYYLNQLIRGALITIALLLITYLVLALSEHYFYFNKSIRTLLTGSFLLLTGWTILRMIALPLMHYFKLGKVISHEQAAGIIGTHFQSVEDKLLNILQLRKEALNSGHRELILASIQQKSESIRLVPFRAAVDFTKNKKYLRYAIPPLVIFLGLLFTNNRLITESTNRLIRIDKDFEKPAPFQFQIENKNLKALQFSDFELKVTTEGSVIPNDIFIEVEKYQYRLIRDSQNVFHYTFANVTKDLTFRLYAGEVQSVPQKLSVVYKPHIGGFKTILNYPPYVGKKNETLENIGDINVPQGTNIQWVFETDHANGMKMEFPGTGGKTMFQSGDQSQFRFQHKAMQDAIYKVFIMNPYLPKGDSVQYSCTVIPDLHPSIQVNRIADSTNRKLSYFIGEISDDYGLSNLQLVYHVIAKDGKQGPDVRENITYSGKQQAGFTYTLNTDKYELKEGEEMSYYFEIFDNDAVNGSKSSKSQVMSVKLPSQDEMRASNEKSSDEVKDELTKALKDSKKLQEDIKKLSEKLLQEKEPNWQQRKELEKMINQQKELNQQIQNSKEKYDEILKNQNEYNQNQNEQLLEKQEKLQEFFQDVMSDEMKKLMEEIEKLLQELNKDQMLDKMKDMKLNNDEMNKELDRMMEMMKQLDAEKKLADNIEKLNELAQKQEELSQKTEEQKESNDALQKEQENIQKDLKEVQQKLDELKKENKDLENPLPLQDNKEEIQDIEKDMDQGQQEMKQNQNSKASKSQKKAADKMKKMSEKMQAAMEQSEEEQEEEDIKAIRQLLENIVGLSFAEEGLMNDVTKTEINTPLYNQNMQSQFKIKDEFKTVEDSLQALSKRNFQIESFVNEKVKEIKSHMESSMTKLEERSKNEATMHQQHIMKNLNDLALMLSESMNQMQQSQNQKKSGKPGSKACKNPGENSKASKNGKKPKDVISQGQKSLNEQMKQMKEGLKNQNQNNKANSEQYAKMAARQAALRRALEGLQKEKSQQGQRDKDLQDMIQQMDKTEEDLVNKRLTDETMKRQNEILTRLLEHEKAQRERDWDEKRKSESANDQEQKVPPAIQEYLKKRQAELDQLKLVNPALKPYYKKLVEDYIRMSK